MQQHQSSLDPSPSVADSLTVARIPRGEGFTIRLDRMIEIGYASDGLPLMRLRVSSSLEEKIGELAGSEKEDAVSFFRKIPELLPEQKRLCVRGDIFKTLREKLGGHLEMGEGRSGPAHELILSLRRLIALVNGEHPREILGVGMCVEIKTGGGEMILRFESKFSAVIQRAKSAFEDGVRAYAQDREGAGESKDVPLPRRTRAERYLSHFERVITLRSLGYPVRDLERKTGVAEDVFRRWLYGELPNTTVNLQPQNDWRIRKAAAPHPIPYVKDACYLLGAFCATRVQALGQRGSNIHFFLPEAFPDPRLMECIERLKPLDGKVTCTPETTEGIHYTRVSLSCLSMTRSLNRITDFNQRIPVEYLTSEADRAEFLRGFFRYGGMITLEGLKVSFRNRPRVAVEFATLLAESSIIPTVQLTDHPSVQVENRRDIQALQKLDVFTRSTDIARLEATIARLGENRSHPAEVYERFILLRTSNPEMNLCQLARAAEISRSIAGAWANGKKPREVLRKERLEELQQEINQPWYDSLRFLCRELRLDRRVAVPLARFKTLAELRATAESCALVGVDPAKDPKILSFGSERIKVLLGAADSRGLLSPSADLSESSESRRKSVMESYLAHLGRFPLLTVDEERHFLRLSKSGDSRARTVLVNCNLRLVVSVAMKHRRKGDLLDVIANGNHGLLEAIDRFDLERKNEETGESYRLSTYAYRYIEGYIKSAYQRDSKRMHLSLDAPIYSDGDASLSSTLDESAFNPNQTIKEGDRSELYMLIHRAFKVGGLNAREQRVLKLRVGMDNDGVALTLEEIGEIFGVTRERIRQIEAQALNKFAKIADEKLLRELAEFLGKN